jgi:ankyrin repeat protein
MQEGVNPASVASQRGYTETLSLLLSNKADVNVANKVQQLMSTTVFIID